jgi:hypothetical protein
VNIRAAAVAEAAENVHGTVVLHPDYPQRPAGHSHHDFSVGGNYGVHGSDGGARSAMLIFIMSIIAPTSFLVICGGGEGCAGWPGRWQPVATDEVPKALLSL